MDISLFKLLEIMNGAWDDLMKAAKENDKEAALRVLIRLLNKAKAWENPSVLLHPHLGDAFLVQLIRDISFIEGAGNYCWVYILHKKEKRIKVRGNLKDFEAFFTLFDFQRVHKSYLVHLPNIERVATDHSYIEMDNMLKPKMSEEYVQPFLEIYARFLPRKNFIH